jgi:hypothetical protein
MWIAYFKENLLSNFLVIIIKDEIHFRRKNVHVKKVHVFRVSKRLFKEFGGLSMYVVQLQVGQQLWWQQINLKKLVQSLIYKPEKEILVKA